MSIQIGGERGIRTLEGLTPSLVFKTSAFNRSAISPKLINIFYMITALYVHIIALDIP